MFTSVGIPRVDTIIKQDGAASEVRSQKLRTARRWNLGRRANVTVTIGIAGRTVSPTVARCPAMLGANTVLTNQELTPANRWGKHARAFHRCDVVGLCIQDICVPDRLLAMNIPLNGVSS